MTSRRGFAARLLVAAVVAVVVVGASGVAPLLAGGGDGGGVDPGPEHPGWSSDSLAPDRLESTGEVEPDGEVGTVVIDDTHSNRFEDEDVRSLERAIVAAGGHVRDPERGADMPDMLAEADVFVVVDPGLGYSTDDVEAIEAFVEDGGRLIVLGEPNRKVVETQGFSTTLATERSRLSQLASAFGISFDSEYLYDMERNDGNFKDVVTSPPPETDHEVVEGVERVSLSTAAAVNVEDGTVLLRTAPTAERGNEANDSGFPVAVLAADGDVLAVGDSTFLRGEYDTVADNDLFIQRIVEFMAGADHAPSTPTPPPSPSPTPSPSPPPSPTPSPSPTPTATPTPTAADASSG